jgi:hypothetical protein
MVQRALLTLMRIGAVVQGVLGVGFWTGHWYGAVPVHMMNGIAYVVMLWLLALIALFQKRTIGIALAAILWGFGVAMLGFTQHRILAGSNLHWIVRVVHLIVGVAALAFAERLVAVRRVNVDERVAAA